MLHDYHGVGMARAEHALPDLQYILPDLFCLVEAVQTVKCSGELIPSAKYVAMLRVEGSNPLLLDYFELCQSLGETPLVAEENGQLVTGLQRLQVILA